MQTQLPHDLSVKRLGRPIRLKLVPNEDGLGPSNTLLYIAHGLAEIATQLQIQLELTVQNFEKAAFNQMAYTQLKNQYPEVITKVEVIGTNSIIILIKKGEQVRPMETAEILLEYHRKVKSNGQPYKSGLSLYERSEKLDLNSKNYDAYICMGVPAVHRVPYDQGTLVIEVFDHSWPLSIAKIIEDDRIENPHDWRTRRIRDIAGAEAKFGDSWPEEWRDKYLYEVIKGEIIKAIDADDAKVHRVFLFPDPIAPGEFFCKWSSEILGGVKRIEGILGGWDGQEATAVKTLAKQILGRRWFKKASALVKSRIILVQGGGTPTWDRLLLKMLSQCLSSWKGRLPETLFLFTHQAVKSAFGNNPEAAREWGWENFEDLVAEVEQSEITRLIKGDELKDFQMYYLVADFVFSRPGGITVQDAISCRTAICCAAEPGHWQTEKIRRHCELYKVMRTVPFAAFETGGIGTVVDQYGMEKENQRMREIQATFKIRQERIIAQEIFDIIAERLK